MHNRGSKNRQANGFTSEVEDKVIMGEFSHRLYRTLVNSPNKVLIDSEQTQTQTQTPTLQIGYYLRYK